MNVGKFVFLLFFVFLLNTISAGEAMSAMSLRERGIEARLGKLELIIQDMKERGLLDGNNKESSGRTGEVRNLADAMVRIDELEEQIRSLRGQLETSNHRSEMLSRELEKVKKNFELRLNELEEAQRKILASQSSGGDVDSVNPEASSPFAAIGSVVSLDVPPPASSPSGVAGNDDKASKIDGSVVIAGEKKDKKRASEADRDEVEKEQQGEEIVDVRDIHAQEKVEIDADEYADVPLFSSPREHYNHAFTMMNKAEYEEAGKIFEAFLKRYPDDELRGNVYYWLGETHYVRENYEEAVDNFRKGFEEMPNGRKAPDNLLKLSMSLKQLGKNKEGCTVLKQLLKKYPSPETVRQKAKEQLDIMKCSK